jgi:hypothetical protein
MRRISILNAPIAMFCIEMFYEHIGNFHSESRLVMISKFPL